MSPEEILQAALALISEYTNRYPTAHSPMYRRIAVRQRQLFVMASVWNREYYGVCAVGELVDGTLNFATMETAGLYPIETIERVNVEDPGSAYGYTIGQRVNIVPIDDYDSHLILPRATIRSNVLRGVSDDLDEVASVEVFYTRRPKAITLQGVGTIEIEDPFQDLLVFDLGRDLLRRTITIEPQMKSAALAVINEAEAELLAAFEAHVVGYVPVEDRFR